MAGVIESLSSLLLHWQLITSSFYLEHCGFYCFKTYDIDFYIVCFHCKFYKFCDVLSMIYTLKANDRFLLFPNSNLSPDTQAQINVAFVDNSEHKVYQLQTGSLDNLLYLQLLSFSWDSIQSY